MILLKNVGFQYGNRKILKNISLSVQKGSFYGVIGPNGAGKTTLMNIITGLRSDFTGRVYIKNKSITEYKIKELARQISVVPQQMDIRFPYTCLEIVMMGRTPYKSRLRALSRRDMGIVRRCMEMTDTIRFADCLITELSGGEKQRVILAKALAQQPEVLFLDEAFSHMDIYYSVKCLNVLKQLVDEDGLTVVCIMHDLNLVSSFCSEVVMLQNGEVVRQGRTETVMKPELIHGTFKIKVAKAGNSGLAVLPEL
ncbi:iron complex transport system ATP-binding protein [Desulfohalotomaculum tongense]|uniref:ABC transporter ATP-binding protein n=1 Tax=Desulforadius tongensis TaxID=1216062 RepID=UPI00195DBE68|nr:ABC transporter ATP-binding protein [Desulforadius tongensis]MBM7854771.1 iron complex transport system ATP-binding protein [Desulforadius tongensis]